MTNVLFHPLAEEELAHAAQFYEQQAAGLGGAFLDEIERAVNRAVMAPHAGAPLREGLRRQFVRRFPFSVLYRIDDGTIFILAVMHHRRRPGYWRGRA